MDKKTKIRILREQGVSYRVIGKICGCSAQYAWEVTTGGEKRERLITEDDCIYAGLREWMNDHNERTGDISFVLYGRRDSGYHKQTKMMLSGRRTIYKDHIDILLKHTGLKYEEAFASG